jgi:holliday junction DNA helicase RuvA
VIGYLRGKIIERAEEAVTLDVNGVGYELQCSSTTLMNLTEMSVSQEAVQVWVQTYIREDAISLFGFATTLEKKMFLSLIKVNGVGPKMAIKILSAARIEQLAAMIDAGDVRALSSLPKVGKKTAEQLILSLKGKLVLDETEKPSSKMPTGRGASANPALSAKFSGVRADVLSALVNLGFRFQEVEKVVADMPEEIELQQGVRKGLQVLSGSF